MVQDVTAAKRAEAALRESEERYRTLFGAIDVGFCIVEMKFDGQGRAVDYRLAEINPAFERQTGLYGAAGRWVSEAAPGLERHWFDLYGEVARSGRPIRFENHAEPFGRWYDVHAFRTGAPELNRVAILFNDITDRRRAEDGLRDLAGTLEGEVAARTAEIDRMWATAPDLMMVLDFDGVVRRVNPAWTALLGYAPQEIVGHPLARFVAPQDRGQALGAFAADASGSARAESRYLHKDGSQRWIAWTAAPAGGMTYATGRDMTQERERAAELDRAQEALRQSQKMEAVGQLTGGLAHDFNNLLAGISGSLEMIETRIAQGRGEEIGRYVAGAQGAARRAAALTHRLLAFSRRQTLEPKPTDVDRLVAGMEELVRRTVGPQVSVSVAVTPGLWPTLVDPNQLENALLNLCINARDAMPDGGRIAIETANVSLCEREARARDLPAGDYVKLRVCDTGTGMTPDVMARAFDPFFTTKPIGMGTGLGLSMIYGFARQSGGQVRIESAPGNGTCVNLTLPRHHGEAAPEAAPEPARVTREPTRRTVLVVDDEPLVRMLVVDVVEELGYAALEAGDGPQALGVLRGPEAIDLLVTDVGLPNGMNGRQVADAARELRPGLKVLFVTGYAETSVLAEGDLDTGMQVVTKPFDMTTLAARIRTMTAG
ncbi:PAS sensor protein [Aurantimonas sp. Leaf443]|nr:PAS sensor protein [Aurantimonas sp. Leaf443]